MDRCLTLTLGFTNLLYVLVAVGGYFTFSNNPDNLANNPQNPNILNGNYNNSILVIIVRILLKWKLTSK